MTEITVDDIFDLQRIFQTEINRLDTLHKHVRPFIGPHKKKYSEGQYQLLKNINEDIRRVEELKYKFCRLFEEQYDQSPICQTTSM